MRFAEEILLLLLDEQSGALLPLPPRALDIVLAGAVLMDLQLEGRIDTDLESLMVLDSSPLDDDLLDPTLAELAESEQDGDAAFWVDRTAAHRGQELQALVIDRLVSRGILARPSQDGFLALTGLVSRARRYPTADGEFREVVHLRIMRVLFSDDIPDPRDVVIIGLADACGLFRRILPPAEFQQVRDRIGTLGRMDEIGRAVSWLLRVAEASRADETSAPRSAPRARGLPWIGNTLDLARHHERFLVEQYRRHGPVFEIRVLRNRYTVLAGLEANECMMRLERTHLATADHWDGFRKELGASRFLLGMDGPEHHRMRRALRDGFSRGLIERNIPQAVRIVRERAATWKLHVRQPGFRTFQHIVADQLGQIAASSVAPEYTDDVILVFKKLVLAHVAKAAPMPWRRGRFKRSLNRVRQLARIVLAEHQMHRRRGADDLVDDLIQLHRADPRFLPETDLPISALLPFFAGIDTSASAMAFTLHALLIRPELRERVTAEADSIFSDGLPTVENLRALDVSRRVIMETLRMHPVVPFVKRSVATSFEFCGHKIRAGENLIVALSVPHFLPQHFPAPERFDIDRYLPGRDEHKQLLAYAPFGLGAHRCLGANLAESQILLTLATVLHDNELALDPPGYKLKTVPAPFQSPDARFQFKVTGRR